MQTAGTTRAESIKGRKPTTCGSWNKPSDHVELVSRSGRSRSQQGNPSPEAMSGPALTGKHKLQVLKMLQRR